MVSDRKDCTCGAASDSRKIEEILERLRDFSSKLIKNHSGRTMEVSRPGVVPQPFPGHEYLREVGMGETADGWKESQESPKVGDDRGNLSLLKHDF